jgi:hypothetical protein
MSTTAAATTAAVIAANTTGWRVFLRDPTSGFFLEAFENCATWEEVEKAVETARKERRDFKVLNKQTCSMEMMAQ